jgi:hypothetical protein
MFVGACRNDPSDAGRANGLAELDRGQVASPARIDPISDGRIDRNIDHLDESLAIEGSRDLALGFLETVEVHHAPRPFDENDLMIDFRLHEFPPPAVWSLRHREDSRGLT